jgi:hypothetical protein
VSVHEQIGTRLLGEAIGELGLAFGLGFAGVGVKAVAQQQRQEEKSKESHWRLGGLEGNWRDEDMILRPKAMVADRL